MFTDNSPLQAAKLSILATTTKFQWAADTQIPDHYHVRCRNKNEDNLSCSWISCTTRNDTQGCGVGLADAQLNPFTWNPTLWYNNLK